jgi:HSP20 family protein
MVEGARMLSTYRDPFDLFRDFDFLSPVEGKVRRYPLTNISYDKAGENVKVEIACAGFSAEDIDVELIGDKLVIAGTKEEKEEKEEVEYIQKHISTSSFERKIHLHEDFLNGEVSAEYKDGLLTITVSKAEKPKKLIEIKSA